MKKYVIICESMHRARCLWNHTLCSLDMVFKTFTTYPILSIETHDYVLYFVSEDYWFKRGGRLGRHDWKPLRDTYFEEMLDEWKENKKC